MATHNRLVPQPAETVDPSVATSSQPAPAKARHRELSAPIAIMAVIVVALSLRPSIVSVGPILPSVIKEFGLSHAGASLMTAIPDVMMGVLAVPAPWLARRYGRDPVLIAALLVLCVSTLARAYAWNTAQLLTATIGVGAGIAITGALIAGFIKARFATKAALLMGIYATALSLGSTIAAAATGPVAAAASGGWRTASGMWAAAGVVAIAAWLVVAMAETREHAPVRVAAPPDRLPFRNPTAWLVAGYFACINLLFYALLAWIAPIYRELGWSPALAGLALASFTGTFMLGNPVLGWLSRSDDRRVWLALCAGLALAGLVPVAISPTYAPFVFIPLLAFGLGGAFTLSMTLPLDNARSVSEANVWNAFTLLVGYLVAAAGPLLAGFLRDLTGNFHASLWLLVATAVVMVGLTPFLQPRHYRQRQR